MWFRIIFALEFCTVFGVEMTAPPDREFSRHWNRMSHYQTEWCSSSAKREKMSLGSGFGPATCWITHKGLETWARLARERHKSTPTTPEKKNPDKDGESPKEGQVRETHLSVLSHSVYPGLLPSLCGSLSGCVSARNPRKVLYLRIVVTTLK